MGDPRAEHLATRRAAGLFDFSFMSLVEVCGADAPAFLSHLQTRSLARLPAGRIAYTLLLREDGSVFIDATLWRHADARWWLFTGRRSDVAWITPHTAGLAVQLRDLSGQRAILALQGPASGRILARVIGKDPVMGLGYFDFAHTRVGTIGRLGYSGELGYEIIVRAEDGEALWRTLREAGTDLGLSACGFEAADSLRIESGYVLFGREITGEQDPFALRLERLVDSHADFIGREALAGRSPQQRLVGLEFRDQPAGRAAGEARVTSECQSPLFGHIGLGFLAADAAQPGRELPLADGRVARIASLPFYDPQRLRPRAAPL